MRKRRTQPLQVESLESIQLLSTMAGLPAAALAAQVAGPKAGVPPRAQALRLSGTVKGGYTFVVNSETDVTFQMKGSGSVAGLGGVKMATQLTRTDPDTMQVVLSNRRGSITLRLDTQQGDLTTQSAGRSQRASYTITSGTGAYSAAQGQGTADVMLIPQLASLGLSGRVSLTLRPDRR